jgi:hypothetical protein
MWMVDPMLMCRKHLLGEHVEIHMLTGSLRRGRSIAGFLTKGLLEPGSARRRHDELAREMARRGYVHRSALPSVNWRGGERVDAAVALEELRRRCAECAERTR